MLQLASSVEIKLTIVNASLVYHVVERMASIAQRIHTKRQMDL